MRESTPFEKESVRFDRILRKKGDFEKYSKIKVRGIRRKRRRRRNYEEEEVREKSQ